MSRKDKHEPQEVSSKQPVSVLRLPPSLSSLPKPHRFHDPRFDRSVGHYNDDLFRKSYSFLDPLQQKELAMVREQLSKPGIAEDRRMELQRLLDRAKGKEKQREKEERRRGLIKEWKETEKELVRGGLKKPYYLKKGDIRRMEVIDEYRRTKEKNPNADIDKLLEKKRKKKASKQHRNLPVK